MIAWPKIFSKTFNVVLIFFLSDLMDLILFRFKTVCSYNIDCQETCQCLYKDVYITLYNQ